MDARIAHTYTHRTLFRFHDFRFKIIYVKSINKHLTLKFRQLKIHPIKHFTATEPNAVKQFKTFELLMNESIIHIGPFNNLRLTIAF